MDSVVHFEIPADDIEKAKKFYKTVFGWEAKDYPEMKYTGLWTSETDPKTGMPKKNGRINGGMRKRNAKGEGPSISMYVKSIEETLKKVEKFGGKPVGPKMQGGTTGEH